jgi:hypothetical protein
MKRERERVIVSVVLVLVVLGVVAYSKSQDLQFTSPDEDFGMKFPKGQPECYYDKTPERIRCIDKKGNLVPYVCGYHILTATFGFRESVEGVCRTNEACKVAEDKADAQASCVVECPQFKKQGEEKKTSCEVSQTTGVAISDCEYNLYYSCENSNVETQGTLN